MTVQKHEPEGRQSGADISKTGPARTSGGWGRIVTVLALIGVGALAWVYGRPYLAGGPAGVPGGAPPPPAVTVAKPVVKDVIEWQEFTGRFVASDQVDIRSRIAGYVEQIHFKDGAVVKTGDLLFTIDQRPAKFALEQAQAAKGNAQSRIEFAERDMLRADALRSTGAVSQTTADQRRRDVEVAKSDLQSAEAAIGRAKLDMEYATIRAPFAGRVSRRNVSVGNLVKVDDTILTTLVAIDPIYFYFDVDERSVLQAMREQQAAAGSTRITRDVLIALTDEKQATHKGVLDFVDNRLDDATGTLRMRAVVQNPEDMLQAGLFGRIRIPSPKPVRGILVPDEAIASDQDRRIVYVIGEDGTAKATTILPGTRVDGYRLVRSGLKGDETIVVNGLLRVRPGAKVQPKLTTLPAVGDQAQPAPKG